MCKIDLSTQGGEGGGRGGAAATGGAGGGGGTHSPCRVHYRILPNKHACINKHVPDFWVRVAISQKLLSPSESCFQHSKLTYSGIPAASVIGISHQIRVHYSAKYCIWVNNWVVFRGEGIKAWDGVLWAFLLLWLLDHKWVVFMTQWSLITGQIIEKKNWQQNAVL